MQRLRPATEPIAELFAGMDRAIVMTSGLGTLAAEDTSTEDARPGVIPQFPRASEQTAFAPDERGARASVVRPARSAHGIGECHGFVPQLARLAREKGVSASFGDDRNPWPAVHRLDAAWLFPPRSRSGGRRRGVSRRRRRPAVQVDGRGDRAAGRCGHEVDDARGGEAHFGPLSMWVTGRAAVLTEKTKAALGWEPRRTGLMANIRQPDYHG